MSVRGFQGTGSRARRSPAPGELGTRSWLLRSPRKLAGQMDVLQRNNHTRVTGGVKNKSFSSRSVGILVAELNALFQSQNPLYPVILWWRDASYEAPQLFFRHQERSRPLIPGLCCASELVSQL